MTTATIQPNLLLLCADEQAANLDRRALRDAGFPRLRIMTSGIEAASLLAGLTKPLDGLEPDIVICLNRLADMEGEQFCAIVRQHPRLLAFPILLILPNDNEVEQLRTLGCGASALMGRPYSVDSLKKQIANLARNIEQSRQLRKAAQIVNTSAFDDALATYGVLLRTERQPDDYFKVGMRCLEESRFNVAIAAFEHALRDTQIKAEAELGIAAAYKGKGDMQRFKAWLARASESFVRAKRWNRARTAYARLLQHDPSARNPFLAEAHKLIREGEYELAADVLAQSLGLMEKKKTGERLARVCLSAEEPDEMYAALEKSLERDAPTQHDYLSEEIRATLDLMIQQKRERQRQLAAERKWQLAQNLGLLHNQVEAEEEPVLPRDGETTEIGKAPVPQKGKNTGKVEARNRPVVATFGEAPKLQVNIEQAAAKAKAFGSRKVIDDDFDEDDYEDDVLEPFTAEGQECKKTKFNELLSVVKLTWKLTRKSRNR